MITVGEDNDIYISSFERFEKEARAGSWFAPTRRAAISRFAEMGFPTTRDEAWRYTNVAPLARTPFRPPATDGAAREARFEPQPDHLRFGEWAAIELVFVNGRYSERLSRVSGLPDGAKICGLSHAFDSDRETLERHLARYADHASFAFTALNTAFLEDGAFVHIPKGAVVRGPIHLLFISTSSGSQREPAVTHPRVLIVVEEGGQVTVVESYVGRKGEVYFTNAVTEIVAGDGSVIDHYKLQRESVESYHVATIQARLGRNSSLSSLSVSLGALLARHDINVLLDDEGADCTLNGLYVVGGRQHVDHHTVLDHARPHGNSRELYKGVLDGQARGVFDGTVIVRKDAQKTDSRQENRNLILSPEALVDTKPTLLINADDVKCSHAATIGQIDEQSMFYLRSRGIDAAAARRIMMHAFVGDILRRIKIEVLKQGLDGLLFPEPESERDPSAGLAPGGAV